MSLRRPFAAVLQFLRSRQGLTQHEIAGTIAQSHISNLESLKNTPTVDTTNELAAALKVDATAFFAMVIASDQRKSAREVLLSAIAELERLGLADEILSEGPQRLEPAGVTKAKAKKQMVQELKAKGFSRSEVVRELGYSKATVGRLWDGGDDE